jgi:hypothetical protein
MGTKKEDHWNHNRNNRNNCSIRKDAETVRPLPQGPELSNKRHPPHIRRMVGVSSYRSRAQLLRNQLMAEDGVATAVAALESML